MNKPYFLLAILWIASCGRNEQTIISDSKDAEQIVTTPSTPVKDVNPTPHIAVNDPIVSPTPTSELDFPPLPTPSFPPYGLFGGGGGSRARAPSTPVHEDVLEADIIVVGAGTSGSVLLNRLSESGRFSVLGLEAGQNFTDEPAIKAVGLSAFLLPATAAYRFFWWGWRQTQPQTNLNNRVGGDWITGWTLGGASSVSGLYYGRGSNSSYAQWEIISGSAKWSSNNILDTFKDLENYIGLTITPDARGDGNGPVDVVQTPTLAQLTANVLLPSTQAAFAGIPTVNDYNDPTVENCLDTRAQWLIDPSGTNRVSSATAFLNSDVMTPEGKGVDGRKLEVIFNAVVNKIIINQEGVAEKVQFIKGDKLIEARAKKAVIVASGINSSKLLQLSGIGPQSVLDNAGITPVYINENVGKHLKSHPLITITLLASQQDNGVPPGAPYAYTIHNVYLPTVGGSASDPRTFQILFDYIPASLTLPPQIKIKLALVSPESEGAVAIQSDNPFQIAAVDDGVYQDLTDLLNMKNAIKIYIRDLLSQLALSNYFPVLDDPINLVIISNYDDNVVENYVKNNTNLKADSHHYSSHCQMALLDEGGVVDGNTKVHGTKNLFVVDASIFPTIPSIDTLAAALMIGWRGSEIVMSVVE